MMNTKNEKIWTHAPLVLLLLLISRPLPLGAQTRAGLEELERKLSNPLSDLTTLPFQFNHYYRDGDPIGSELDFQLATATHTEKFTLINRFSMPYVETILSTKTPNPNGGESLPTSTSGLGDFNYQLYITPHESSGLTWGAGVFIGVPTGVDGRISSGRWGLGPTLGVVQTLPYWTFGMLLHQNWSVGKDEDRDDVNLLTIQPILSYSLPNFWRVSPFSDIIYNGKLDDDKWVFPLGLQFTKLIPREFTPISLGAGVFSHVVHPDNAAEWSLKFQATFVL